MVTALMLLAEEVRCACVTIKIICRSEVVSSTNTALPHSKVFFSYGHVVIFFSPVEVERLTCIFIVVVALNGAI